MSRRWGMVLVILLMLGLVACERGAPTGVVSADGPAVTIDSPANNSRVSTGTEVEIISTARDDDRVTVIELYVNDELISEAVTPSADGQESFSTIQRWVPPTAGAARVRVQARNSLGQTGPPATILLDVVGPGFTEATPSATLPPVPVDPTPTLTLPPPPDLTPTDTPLPPPPVVEVPGRVNVQLGLNVRAGPGTAFQRIGGVNVNETVTAIARNVGGDWVKIRYRDNAEGWIAAQFVVWEGEIEVLPVE